MKVFNTCLLLASVIALSACSDSNSKKSSNSQNAAMDSDGNCSSQTVSLFNDIKSKTESFNSTRNTSYLEGAQKACTDFKALIGDNTCKAVKLDSGSTTYISKSTVSAVCDEVSAKLNQKPQPNPGGSAPAPLPGLPGAPSDSQPISSLTHGFEIKVKDSSAINELLTAAQNAFLQDGKVIRSVVSLDQSKGFCYLEKKDLSMDVRADDIIKISSISATGEKLGAVTADLKVQMGCMKIRSTSPWTLQDLKDVFGSTAEIKAAN